MEKSAPSPKRNKKQSGTVSKVKTGSNTIHKLTILIRETYALITKVKIFDHQFALVNDDEPISFSEEYRVYSLTSGKYVIRVIINGLFEDNEIELIKDKTCGIAYQHQQQDTEALSLPKLYSSAPLKGDLEYSTTHDYYLKPAVAISSMPENPFLKDKELKSGLFIFIHYPSKDLYQERYRSHSYWEKFSLLGSNGELIKQFPEGCIQDRDNHQWNIVKHAGYIGFRLSTKPGLYYLQYNDDQNGRIIPLYVYESWYTQFFMTVIHTPLFETIRIFLSHKLAFDPYDKYHGYIDICLNKLQNNDYSVAESLVRNIAYGKFQSPMLGLLGAYLYLSSKEVKENELFKMIVYNIQEKILKNSAESPDLWALNMLSYKHFGTTISGDESKTISGAPMLRIAFDVIRNAAVAYPWLVPEGSINDYIAENQTFDSPYNTFLPSALNAYRKATSNAIRIHDLEIFDAYNSSEDNVLMDYQEHSPFPWEKIKVNRDENQNKNLQDSLDSEKPPKKVLGLIDRKILAQRSAKLQDILKNPNELTDLSYTLLNHLTAKPNMSNAEVAKQLNMPINTISRLMKDMGL